MTAAQLRANGLNPEAPLPAKYDVHSAGKERLQRKHELMKWWSNAPGYQGLDKNVSVATDAEIDYLEDVEKKKQLAEFDEYVAKLIDPKKPGNMQWLMNVYPEFVQRRIAQIHADHKYALDNTMIEAWGINTFEDLFMKFMIDNRKLDGPMLMRREVGQRTFRPGWMSIFRDADKRVGADMTAYPYQQDNYRRPGVRIDADGQARITTDAGEPGDPMLAMMMNEGQTGLNAFRSRQLETTGFPGRNNPRDIMYSQAAR